MDQLVGKKILFVITKSNWGGAQRYVYDLATTLPKDQFDVRVAFGISGLLSEKLQEAGITTHKIFSLRRDVSFGADIKTFFELVRLFREQKPDIVHLNSSKAGGVGALAARLAGVENIIFTVHGWPFLENRSIIAKIFIWIASWFTVLLCHKVICISDYDLRIAKRMPFVGDKVVRIYNGISPMSFGTGEKIRNVFPSGAKITGTIGELTKNKNQMVLIEQAKNNSDMYVAIVGEGEDRPQLEAAIKKYGLAGRVKLFGFIPANEVLRSFDVFALPSLKEGLPYVLLEAKAADLPIVANRVGGVGEILDAPDMSEFSLDRMVQKTITLYSPR
jgi:glycosyltransferase involved in cell wall biosynthesis